MSQKSKYIINNVLWNFISVVITGAMLQTFLLEKGVSEEQVGQTVSLMQFVQMSVIFIFSRYVDKIKNIISLTACSHILYLPVLILSSVMCYRSFNSVTVFTVCSAVAFFAVGLYNVLCYKIPYHITDMKNYGNWTGVSGWIAAVFMLVLTSLLSVFQNKFGYFPVMRIFYPLSVVCVGLFILFTALYKDIGVYTEKKEQKKIFILKYKPFTYLIVPNLIRGFCSGIIGMAVTIGYSSGQLDSNSAAILLVVSQVVSIPANLIYTKFTGKEPLLILISSFGILGSVLFLGKADSTGFLILYGFAYFFMMIVNVAVPVLVVKIVDYDIAGQYNGWRILLNTAGVFIASAVCLPLVKLTGVTGVWIIAGCMQVISGAVYYIYCKKTHTIHNNEVIYNE